MTYLEISPENCRNFGGGVHPVFVPSGLDLGVWVEECLWTRVTGPDNAQLSVFDEFPVTCSEYAPALLGVDALEHDHRDFGCDFE